MTDEKGYCPVCGAPIFSFVIQGPGGHARVGPCGHTTTPENLLEQTSSSGETNEIVEHNADATGPEDVAVAYVTAPTFRSWALHAARNCPLVEGRGREGQPVDPRAFPYLGWCSVCSPWLVAAQPGHHD